MIPNIDIITSMMSRQFHIYSKTSTMQYILKYRSNIACPFCVDPVYLCIIRSCLICSFINEAPKARRYRPPFKKKNRLNSVWSFSIYSKCRNYRTNKGISVFFAVRCSYLLLLWCCLADTDKIHRCQKKSNHKYNIWRTVPYGSRRHIWTGF